MSLRKKKDHKKENLITKFLSSSRSSSITWDTFRDVSQATEWHKLQEQTYLQWINFRLDQAGEPPIQDLFTDLQDGTVLIKLLEVLAGCKVASKSHEKSSNPVHHIANLTQAFNWMSNKSGKNPKPIKLTNIGPQGVYLSLNHFPLRFLTCLHFLNQILPMEIEK
jgi:hypothetical protein